MLMLRVAFRNVLRQRRRTILTVLTMMGGFTLAAISIGFSDGSYHRVIDMFTRNRLGHIQIHAHGYLDRPSLYRNLSDLDQLAAKIDGTPGVRHWAPRLKAAGLASVGDKSTGVKIIGIDPKHENAATRFDRKITSGAPLSRAPNHEVVLGVGLARVLQATPGDELVIVSQAVDGSIANDAYTVVGLAESGNTLDDRSTLYLHLQDAQELFVMPGRVHEIAVVVDDLKHVLPVADALRTATAGLDLDVDPWQVFAAAFYRAMRVDQRGTWIALAIIILIVAVGVLNTVLMTVLERRREYGVMRAVGTSPAEVLRLILAEVAVMAVFSLILGCVLGYVINGYLETHGFSTQIEFTYGGMEFSRMYSENNLRVFVIPALTVLCTALLVSIFPASRAAHTPPARAMRVH